MEFSPATERREKEGRKEGRLPIKFRVYAERLEKGRKEEEKKGGKRREKKESLFAKDAL